MRSKSSSLAYRGFDREGLKREPRQAGGIGQCTLNSAGSNSYEFRRFPGLAITNISEPKTWVRQVSLYRLSPNPHLFVRAGRRQAHQHKHQHYPGQADHG